MQKINDLGLKAAVVVSSVVAIIIVGATNAFATADTATVTALTDSGEDLKDTLLGVANGVLPFAVGIVALLFGWRMVKRFVKA